jgi:hypothetical protein
MNNKWVIVSDASIDGTQGVRRHVYCGFHVCQRKCEGSARGEKGEGLKRHERKRGNEGKATGVIPCKSRVYGCLVIGQIE